MKKINIGEIFQCTLYIIIRPSPHIFPRSQIANIIKKENSRKIVLDKIMRKNRTVPAENRQNDFTLMSEQRFKPPGTPY